MINVSITNKYCSSSAGPVRLMPLMMEVSEFAHPCPFDAFDDGGE
jgi:hypothetical protein